MIYLLAIGSPTHPVERRVLEELDAPRHSLQRIHLHQRQRPASSRISTRTRGSISAISAMRTPITSTIPSRQPRPTKRSASPIPSGTTRTTGAFPHRITRAATRHGEVRRRRVRWMDRCSHMHPPDRWRLFPPIASRFCAPCATSGASRHGAATASSMRFTPPQTGMTPTCSASIRASRC